MNDHKDLCFSCAFTCRIHFGQISSNQMLLSVMDELRTNTLSKVCEIRVSSIWESLSEIMASLARFLFLTPSCLSLRPRT